MKLTIKKLKEMIIAELKEANYGGKSGYRRENPNPMNQQSDWYTPKGDHTNQTRPPADYGYDPSINAVLEQYNDSGALSRSLSIIADIITKNPNINFDAAVNMISDEMTNPFSGNVTPERIRDRYGKLVTDLIAAMQS